MPERTGIDVDGLPWETFIDAKGRDLGVLFKWIVDPTLGKNCMLLRLPPNHRAAPHWHTSDTVYVVTRGEFVIEGEGSFFPDQARMWASNYPHLDSTPPNSRKIIEKIFATVPEETVTKIV